MFADGVLVNHNRVHPDYMLAQETCFASMVAVSLARQYIPQSMVFNADLAYHALTEVQFTPGADTKYGTGKAIAAPGGTIYYRTANGGYSADIYYPQGSDWTTKITDGYLNMDLAAKQLGFDAGKPFSAMGWAKARAADVARAAESRGPRRQYLSAGRLDRQVSGHGRSHLPEQRPSLDAMVADAKPPDVAGRRLLGPGAGWAVMAAE